MNAVEIYEKAVNSLERNKITLGEFEAQIAVLKDVEPVVHCKGCKWFNTTGCALYIVDDTDKPKEDDFCSFGERRTGDE